MSDQPNQPEQKTNHTHWGFFFLTFLMLIIAGAAGFGFWHFFQLTREIKQEVSYNQTNLEQSITDLRQSTDKALTLSAQQEQMINDWKAAQKGNLDKWYVAEAQYLVKLANDHLQFTHNTTMALTLLQRADQVLQPMQDANVLEIRKSIAEKMAALQQLPKVEVTGLYLTLVTLNKVLDQLPMPASPLKAAPTPITVDPNLSWWQKGLDQSWQALRKIVIVRNDMQNVLPLVMPEEKVFLYQNLHAQFESAMWGALHRNADVYQASLARATNWIQIYFDKDAPATQSMLKNISQLQAVNIQPPVISLAPTLQLFDHYFATAT
jgi:uroporphyrin-3 C-methyltransferase